MPRIVPCSVGLVWARKEQRAWASEKGATGSPSTQMGKAQGEEAAKWEERSVQESTYALAPRSVCNSPQIPPGTFVEADTHIPKPMVQSWLSCPGSCWEAEEHVRLARGTRRAFWSLLDQSTVTYPSRRAMTFFLGLPMFGP